MSSSQNLSCVRTNSASFKVGACVVLNHQDQGVLSHPSVSKGAYNRLDWPGKLRVGFISNYRYDGVSIFMNCTVRHKTDANGVYIGDEVLDYEWYVGERITDMASIPDVFARHGVVPQDCLTSLRNGQIIKMDAPPFVNMSVTGSLELSKTGYTTHGCQIGSGPLREWLLVIS